ncbi:MAG: HEAT repeat domain-containing protein [Planctomycetota bacterium]
MRSAAAPVLVLIAALAAVAPAPARGDRPVFFDEPDPVTRSVLDSALEDLRGNSITDHTRGRETLQEIGYWAVAPLAALLRDGSSIEKRNAALALGVIGDPRGIPPLTRSAKNDRHQYVPAFCSLQLGRFGDPSTLPALEQMLKDHSREDRRVGAVLSVAKIRDAESFDLLVKVARTDPGERTRRTALFCLGFFRDRALVKEDGKLVPIPILAKALRSSNERLRRAALLAIALLGHRDLRPLYEKAARSGEGDPTIRSIGLLTLARFPDRDVTVLLLKALVDHRSPETVRVTAALLLMDRKHAEARDRLLKLVPPDYKLRAAVTLALSNFEDPEVVEVILARLGDHKDQVRVAAAIAISRFTKEEHRRRAIERITAILRMGGLDEDVRFNLKRSRRVLQGEEPPGEFQYLGNRNYVEDMTKDVEEKLLDLVNKEARDVLGIEGLTPLRATAVKDRFRVDDSRSELRDLMAHLDHHPYFEPDDIPEPKLVITPTLVDPTGEVPERRVDPAGEGPEKKEEESHGGK